jgi:hypothetical protein
MKEQRRVVATAFAQDDAEAARKQQKIEPFDLRESFARDAPQVAIHADRRFDHT